MLTRSNPLLALLCTWRRSRPGSGAKNTGASTARAAVDSQTGAGDRQPYAPQPSCRAASSSPFSARLAVLKADRIKEPEQYNMSAAVPGRINSIVNIHNPSIEVHR